MTNRISRRALACALLASTALVSPAHAQVATTNPERFLQMDENGVDLLTDTYVEPFTEGKIGSGEGAVSIIRGSWGEDQWSGLIYRTTINGVSTMVVQFGPISDTFTQSGSTWVPTKANGASLAPTGNLGEWLYTARDGSAVIYETYDNVFSGGGLSGGQPEPLTGPPCNSADPGTCGVPMSITRPDGMVFHLNWRFVDECSPKNVFPCQNGTAYFRFSGVTSSAGYGFTRSYATDSPGAGSAPQTNWFARTGVTFSDGTIVTYGSPSSGVTTITDTLGRVWTFTGEADGSTHIRRPGSSTDNIIVGDNTTNGTVPYVTKDGVTTNYSHTVNGTTSTITKTDPLGHTKTIVADLTLGRVTSITDENGHTTSYTYDANGRLTKVTHPEGNYTQYTYDARGNLTATTQVAKAGSGLANIVTSASFDATCSDVVTCNRPHSTTDAKGNVTTYTYDSTTGALLTVTRPAPTAGAVQPQTRFSYTQVTGAAGDAVTELTGISQCQTTASCTGTADETKVVTAYNSNLLPSSVARENGTGTLAATDAFTYDAAGNLLTDDGPLAGTADTTAYKYDADRELTGEISPDPDGAGSLPNRAFRLTYRGDGQVSKKELGTTAGQTDSAFAAFTPKETVDIAFDANSRPVTSQLSSGGTAYALTQTDYDSLGRLNCTAVRMNTAVYGSLPSSACSLSTQGSFGPDQISQNVYDAAGELTDVKVGVGTADAATERHLAYSNNGLVASLLDGENNLTTYVHDGFDRLSQTQYPSPTKGSGTSNASDFEQLSYDANSNVISRRLRDGTSIAFTYDNLNRVTLKNLPGTEPDVTYAYDNLGRLTSASQTGSSLNFGYDALSRLTSETGPQGTVTSGYDLAGNRTSIAYPGTPALTIAYTYLTTGEVSTIKDGATSLATYAYDNLGNRTGATLGNGVVQSYTYDPVSRLSSLTHDLAGTTNDLTKTLAYSPASQITTETRSNDTYAFVKSDATTSSTANGLNELATVGGASATYDAKGNMTLDPTTGRTFGYSSENLPTSAALGGVTTTLGYDPMMRLYQVAGSTTTRFAYDGVDLLADYNGSDALQHRYVFGPGVDEPIVEYSSTGVRTYLSSDERGSIVARSDSSGNLLTANSYDEYGIPGSGNAGLFQYTGQAWIGQLGMYYYKARIYSPTLGRFIQTDPVGPVDDPNLYQAMHDNSVNLVDPTGLGSIPAPGGDGTFDPSCPNGGTLPSCEPPIVIDAPRIATPGQGDVTSGTDPNRSNERVDVEIDTDPFRPQITCKTSSSMTINAIGTDVNITGNISFPNGGNQYLGDINSSWTGQFGVYDVLTQLSEGAGGVTAHIAACPKADLAAQGRPCSPGSDMYLLPYGSSGYAMESGAHEFGHAGLDLPDKYNLDTGAILPGSQGDIMAQVSGMPTQADIAAAIILAAAAGNCTFGSSGQ
jgi:RHS repeat-associated protein